MESTLSCHLPTAASIVEISPGVVDRDPNQRYSAVCQAVRQFTSVTADRGLYHISSTIGLNDGMCSQSVKDGLSVILKFSHDVLHTGRS